MYEANRKQVPHCMLWNPINISDFFSWNENLWRESQKIKNTKMLFSPDVRSKTGLVRNSFMISR